MNTNNSSTQQGRTFDWGSARRRIAVTNAILAELDEPAPEVLEQIWARRAALLAQTPVQEEEGEQIKLVLIQLGCETYGLDAQYIFEIRPATQITPVPRVPDWVAGVINLRGRVLSVLDLRRFFGLAQAEARDENEMSPGPDLVIVETPSMEVALLANEVLDVEVLPASRVQDATDIVRGIRPEYVRGVVERQDGDGLLVVLDLATLLADERLIVHEEIA
jgi:purine-binding chemotaxis protein CheW